MKKKLLALVLAAAMTLSLASCGGSKTETPSTGSDNSSASSDNSSAEGATYTVGICQLVQHPALDAATQGFIDALNEALPGQVEFENKNASGEANNCGTIVNGFVSEGVDLIMANATDALVAARTATNTIPIVGTSITSYGVALSLKDETATKTGINVTGTADLAPLDKQAAMVKEWVPDAKKVGILYCSAEKNSKYQATVVGAKLKEMGLEVKEYTAADSNEIASVTKLACQNSDVLYVPTDNTMASSAKTIDNIAQPAGVPIIAGEEGIARGCGVAALSISYYDLGYKTGEMAAQVLTGEADIAEMPIQYAPATKMYNPTMCEALGITAPEGYEAME